MKSLLASLLLATLVQSGLAIWCFNCSSYEDPNCATLAANDTASKYYVKCEDTESFCRKTTITIIDSDRYVRVTRSCGFIENKATVDNCYETDDEFKFERSCQCFTDGCNHAASVRHSVGAVFGALLVGWALRTR